MWQSLTEFLLHNQVHLDVDIGNHLDSVELTLITSWTQFESVYPVQRKSLQQWHPSLEAAKAL